MTRSDKWKQRPSVVAYRAWCDEDRLAATGSPSAFIEADVLGLIAFFHLPIPASRQKEDLWGKMHRQTGDVDNRIKSVFDSLFRDDKRIAFVQGYKLYCEEGAVPRTDVFVLVA